MSKHYDNVQRKRIANIINNITIYSCTFDIGQIIADDTNVKKGNSYTINQNGFYIMTDKLTHTTFGKLDKYINSTLKKKVTTEKNTKSVTNSIFNTMSEDSVKETDVKLSSKEKKFIKKIQYDTNS
jgi:hypothetical protein